MKIAIDVDDCISNTAEVDFATCYEYSKKLTPNGKLYKHYVNDFHNAPTIFGLTKEQDDDFYIKQRKQCVEQDLIKPKVFAVKYINQLLQDGHEVIILTSRGDMYWGDALTETKKWFAKYGINYTQLIANISNKGEFCKKNKIDLMIDDNLKYIKQCNDVGIRSITFDNNYNPKYYTEELRNYSSPLNCYASCWNEVYDKIKVLDLTKKDILLI